MNIGSTPTPPPLAEAQRAELKDLAATNDSHIDYSDIPANADWTKARRGVFYRPVKQSTTVRIDADMLHCRGEGTRLPDSA